MFLVETIVLGDPVTELIMHARTLCIGAVAMFFEERTDNAETVAIFGSAIGANSSVVADLVVFEAGLADDDPCVAVELDFNRSIFGCGTANRDLMFA